ncbi:MAG: hypothetical protein JXM70_07430, partial [Pirellulales bacterium]|nr:hypothetical protein [Pirellulales bacterium]
PTLADKQPVPPHDPAYGTTRKDSIMPIRSQLFIYLTVCAAFCFGVQFATAADKDTKKPAAVTLRYQFKPGETLCWEVVHRGKVSATVSGTTQDTEMTSRSLKLWRVADVQSDGTATFVYSVDDVKMRQKLTGRKEIRYNSKTDKKAPGGFEDVAKAVGKPLSKITIDTRGKVVQRDRVLKSPFNENKGQLTVPLPEKPVTVGDTWSEPHEVAVPLETGGIKRVQTLQKYKLKNLKTGVATILVETQILTPISEPAIEAKLIQQASRGRIRFDVDAGRILSQNIDLDKRVVGFRGQASSLHYLTSFEEKLIEAPVSTASRAAETKRK